MVPAEPVAPDPRQLTTQQAAVLGGVGITALRDLDDTLKVQPGESVLVFGASDISQSSAPSASSVFTPTKPPAWWMMCATSSALRPLRPSTQASPPRRWFQVVRANCHRRKRPLGKSTLPVFDGRGDKRPFTFETVWNGYDALTLAQVS